MREITKGNCVTQPQRRVILCTCVYVYECLLIMCLETNYSQISKVLILSESEITSLSLSLSVYINVTELVLLVLGCIVHLS